MARGWLPGLAAGLLSLAVIAPNAGAANGPALAITASYPADSMTLYVIK